jgi:protein involved in polysaccharide export with SLBB domain
LGILKRRAFADMMSKGGQGMSLKQQLLIVIVIMVVVGSCGAAMPSTNPIDPAVLAAGDLVHVSVKAMFSDNLDFVADVHIDDAGNLPLPHLPPVPIAGLTTGRAQQAIDLAYRAANLLAHANSRIVRINEQRPDPSAGPIKIGDHLKARMWGLAGPGIETQKDYTIDESGSIELPPVDRVLVGKIKVLGCKEGEVADLIAGTYRQANLLQDMEVTVQRIAPGAGGTAGNGGQ